MRPLSIYTKICYLYRNFVIDFAMFLADFGIFLLFSFVWPQETHILDVHASTRG